MNNTAGRAYDLQVMSEIWTLGASSNNDFRDMLKLLPVQEEKGGVKSSGVCSL